jgi:diacylglycerol kinase
MVLDCFSYHTGLDNRGPLNTAMEFLADAVSSDYHPLIGQAKDVAAGAVLIAAIGAVIIGMIIIVPYFYQ